MESVEGKEKEKDTPYLTAVWLTVLISHCYCVKCTQADCVTLACNVYDTNDS